MNYAGAAVRRHERLRLRHRATALASSIDEETNTAYDCRCRPQIVAYAKARSLSAVIPRSYRDVAFDRFPVTEIEPQATVAATQALRRPDRREARRRPRAVVHGHRRQRQDDAGDARHQGGAEGRALGRASTRSRDLLSEIRDDLRQRLARRPVRAAGRGRPAAHRRHRRRAARRPGCWRSSTRSSTRATRSSARW